MRADRNRTKSLSNEHEMIEVQYEIQKLEADLEFHKQKTRLIKNALDEKNKKFKFVRTPKFEEVPYPIVMEPNLVIEYYSR